jgi:hypothetical protein
MTHENMTWFLDTNIVIFCLRGKAPYAMRKNHEYPGSRHQNTLSGKSRIAVNR